MLREDQAETNLFALIGKTITKIEMDLDWLRFTLSDGSKAVFGVYGDCCSESYFYDFINPQHLLNNGEILDIKQVELTLEEKKATGYKEVEEDQFYGYQFTTDHPEFGEVTSVFSFRNISNGYYGGSLEPKRVDEAPDFISEPITQDITLV